ncbi:hypothetical protein GOZ90_09690 [Agrobacterium vitis]|uniref:Uncharacterized protein n=1 Tax=Agrobacterium vitis TaxID=373 RepID=A0A6L6VB39_AGRVI|nr:hypothetical protein [Agrobacterium vitis]MUZ72954.1 hypothetical protein [Agrobacterium vitis]
MKNETENSGSRKRPPTKQKVAEPAQYVVTPEDNEALRPFVESSRLPKYTVQNGALRIDHPSEKVGLAKIAAAMGIQDAELYNGAIRQLENIATQGRDRDPNGLNFAISIVRAIAPRDHLEVLLALQMASVHLASIRHVRMLNHTESIAQLDIQERTVNKLMRTFTTQMEALRKHRNGGSQKVRVEHVHVYEGGQAIVGNVSHGGGSISKTSRQSHEEREDDENLSLPVRAALHGNLETDREPVRITGGEVQDGLSFPWRKGGRS